MAMDTVDTQVAINQSVLKAILVGGFVAGLLDILFAFVANGMKGITPDIVLKAVAAGIFGREAYTGGAGMATLGAIFHFGIMLIIAAIYVAAWRKISQLRISVIASGLACGVTVFIVMNYVVLPLSNFPGRAPTNIQQFCAMLFLVGLPITFATKRYAPS